MNLILDHVFVLVEPEAKVAERLVSLGMQEGTRNKHEGQGTSNRRFNFSNGMLELLWVHDAQEAIKGPGHELHFVKRKEDPSASQFGVILRRKDKTSQQIPFEGWTYQPVYFAPPMAFHVGVNSSNLLEPLCIYMPFVESESSLGNIVEGKIEEGIFISISKVQIYTPSEPLSDVLNIAETADFLSIDSADEHLMEITFGDHRCGFSKDLRPDIPLIIHW